MPKHHNLLCVLLIAALPGCAVLPAEYTFDEKRCLDVDASQKQCRSADDLQSREFDNSDHDEVLDVSGPTRVVLNSYQCKYAVSIRGATTQIEHTTLTLPDASKICPLPAVAAPFLQATRNDVTLLSVDAPGTLETTDIAQCCYLVTYKTNAD